MAGSAAQLVSFEDAPYSPVHKKITAGTFMGQICDGYTLGIISIAMTYCIQPLGLDSFWQGCIGSSSFLGILFGCLGTGLLADKFGRKALYLATTLAMGAVTLAQFFVNDALSLTICRFLLGFLVGADYTAGIPLLSEWSPAKKRPTMLAWLLVFWTIGYCMSYIVGFFMDGLGTDGWRYVLCSGIVLLALTAALRLGSPESPKWLAAKGRKTEALAVIRQYLGDYGLPADEEHPSSSSWFALWAPSQWRKTFVSGFFFLAQVLPFFSLSIFLPLVLEKVGLNDPVTSGVIYNVSTILSVLFGTWLFLKTSRRAYLLWTFYLSGGLLALLILWSSAPPMLAFWIVMAFAFVLGMSIVAEFAYPPELFPTELRANGVGTTIAISRLGSASGIFLLPLVVEGFGINAALWFCVGTLILGGIVCQMWAPETSPRFRPDAS